MHMFSTESNVHRYNTRSNAILNHPVTNLFGSEKCVIYHLPRLVEETDSDILEKLDSHCYTGLSIYLRKICVQSYKSECNQPNCYTCQNVPRWYEIWMLYVFFFFFFFFFFCITMYLLSFSSFFPLFLPYSFSFFFHVVSLFLYCSSSFIIVVFDDTHL